MTDNKIVLSATEMNDYEVLKLIEQHASFEIKYITDMKKTVLKIEEIIETNGLTCRVQAIETRLILLFIFIPPVGTLIVLASVLFDVLHLFITRNPDYVVGKSYVGNRIWVNYSKK